MSDELQREVGMHAAQIEGLEKRFDKLEAKLDEALLILNLARGSWKTLVAVGGLMATLGAVVSWFVHFFFGR